MPTIIKCKVCGADMATSAKVCPQCGARAKKSKWWIGVIVVLFCIGACVAGALGDTSGNTDDKAKAGDAKAASASTAADKTKEEKPAAKKEKFEVVGEVTSTSDQFAVYLEGVIKNNSGRKASYVQVTFNLYDKDGNQVGTALANVNNLEADGTWKFKAMGINQNGGVAKYKLAEITGF